LPRSLKSLTLRVAGEQVLHDAVKGAIRRLSRAVSFELPHLKELEVHWQPVEAPKGSPSSAGGNASDASAMTISRSSFKALRRAGVEYRNFCLPV